MAASTLPLDDDDDEFDWEAAVQEIENACELASSSVSISNAQGFATPVVMTAPSIFRPGGGKGRQSTLDRFIVDSDATKRPRIDRSGVQANEEVEQNLVGEDEGISVKIDLEAAKTWIYPVNVPLRDYQLSITRTALFSNTLVVLPTGLGKTLIAAVVMYNYFRWFPKGKIVFTAPSRPLVMQQIEACHNIVGIPQEWTIDMTGQTNPAKRANLWKIKRVFFVTPQVLEKDIQSGKCLVKQLVCLVIDEAHRALGNYSYCVAVRELMAVPVQLRLLALTATPGSKQPTIQNVIDNLHISAMEYRKESDHDVSPYVHNRKLELIKVPMSEDASAINNLLLEVIQPYFARLSAIGVMQSRDVAILSPCVLLNLRDKFRQAPPTSLPPTRYGEVEGYFGVMITLYYILKLLSSHGIKPACDMLEEKLKQGSFGRMMSRNENISKVMHLMQRSLSHGAPNPKLMKMTEILMDHFKKNDPTNSRVIIFSNFRGSVRDIMDCLSNLGDLVRATEFVGQNSGKTLKGQPQKIQQAVLQEFRSGGYNVIVATSIGEEGLDIMEVDLVICFDANISPLRMIQRMGRTGRKHDGRVVVLACEGPELKGYLNKQASGNAVRKHMHNGGINSFNFHASPRMVPHIYKPEVEFVELTIQQFIPRAKTLKEDASHPSALLYSISKEENSLIARYFGSSGIHTWKPSLIAFPGFQCFPSRIHTVRHSFKTTAMLIDTMQSLGELSFSKSKKDLAIEDSIKNHSAPGILTKPNAMQDSTKDCSDDNVGISKNLLQGGICDVEPSCETPRRKDLHGVTICRPHNYLFGGDFISVNALGDVSVPYVPSLPHVHSVISDILERGSKKDLVSDNIDVASEIITKKYEATPTMLHDSLSLKNVLELEDATKCSSDPINPEPCSPNDGLQEEYEKMELVLQTPVHAQCAKLTEEGIAETPGDSVKNPIPIELSPRLTHFIEEGIVPETPIARRKDDNSFHASKIPEDELVDMFQKKVWDHMESFSTMSHNVFQRDPHEFTSNSTNVANPLGKTESHNIKETDINSKRKASASPLTAEQSPMANILTNSSTDDWQMSSGAISVTQAPKYRRLCKYGDKIKKLSCQNLADKYNCSVPKDTGLSTLTKSKLVNCHQGRKKKSKRCPGNFIEEEAEVSEDAQVSEDEVDDEQNEKYEDSFIDDRINPTEENTQAENGGDMFAFYRRSLLTQSPMEIVPKCLVDSVSSIASKSRSYSSEGICASLQTPQNCLQSLNVSGSVHSATCHTGSKQGNLVTNRSEQSCMLRETSSRLEDRKKKLTFQNACSIPTENFQQDISHLELSATDLTHDQIGSDLFCDDEFYQSIDLDAIEAQATELLKYKSRLPEDATPASSLNAPSEINEVPHVNQFSHPSFDLGL
ncbi:DEAD-box ATP-dependent RNA helicase FANCM [Curcuma longa]|uniref:DEAD-box ATP-dependent RNA helicase FANCM n=1 Tax=Curcuma longa TaxID=136217 RepID=UPI003D9E3D95